MYNSIILFDLENTNLTSINGKALHKSGVFFPLYKRKKQNNSNNNKNIRQ
jgi:hypothetical protein